MSDIIIYGRGKTGQSLRKLLKTQGKKAVFYDDNEGFEDNTVKFSDKSTVLLSPGVKPSSAGIIAAKSVGARLVSELEYCFPLCRSKCVSVTGTNGKTTICEMIYHILQSCNKKCRLLGNGGIPFSSEVLQARSNEVVILESSSFQLTDATTFAPYISVFSNLACDHLDYHGNYENYALAKLNNFIHQKDGYAVFNLDDLSVRELSEACHCEKLFYSVASPNANCYFDGNKVIININGKQFNAQTQVLQTYAKHNLSNALAATLVAYALGVPLQSAVDSFVDYKLLPHRMEFVSDFNNVTFINDSKATNVHATVNALKNYAQPLALILGGSDKGEKFDEIFTALGSNVVGVVASGETANAILDCGVKHGISVAVFDDLAQATHYCYKLISQHGGGIVLMSNACASFDKFNGYGERGEYFRAVVEELCGGEKTN